MLAPPGKWWTWIKEKLSGVLSRVKPRKPLPASKPVFSVSLLPPVIYLPPPVIAEEPLETETPVAESPPPEEEILVTEVIPEPPPPLLPWSAPLVEPAISKEDDERRKWEKERLKHDKFVKPKVTIDYDDDDEHEELIRANAKPVSEEHKAKPIVEIDGPLVPEEYEVFDHHEGGDVLYEPAEFYGEFNFRDTILEQLDRYFIYLRRMKKLDPDTYGLYRSIGASITPYTSSGVWLGQEYEDQKWDPSLKFTAEEAALLNKELPPYFNKNRPSFGCIVIGANPLSESKEMNARWHKDDKMRLWIPKFMYFTKFSHPSARWQPMTNGDVYGLTIWWDRPHDPKLARRKYGVPEDFAIWISKDGKTLRLLKEKKKWGRWEYPHGLKEWAKSRGLGTHVFLTHIFIRCIQGTENAESSIVRVNVHKGDLTAVFGINPHRTAYFFQDRDVRIKSHHGPQRVFHMVKPHKRKDGSYVKMHFRGLREFDWSGYHIQLTVPGLHHESLTTFGYGSVGDLKFLKKGDTLSGDEVGKFFASYIATGRFDEDKLK